QPYRAGADVEATIGVRGALDHMRGSFAGRAALALVADRSGATPPGGRTAAGEEVPDARHEESASPPGGVPAGFGLTGPIGDTATLVTHQAMAEPEPVLLGGIRSVVKGTRRNLVAAGAGAALVAVLGTVVTLGMTSNNDANNPSRNVQVGPSASQGANDGSLGADKANKGGGGSSGDVGAATAKGTGTPGAPGTTDSPTPGTTGGPTDHPTGTQGSTPTKSTSPSKPSTTKPSTPTPTKPSGGSPSSSTSSSPSSPSPDPTSTGPTSPSTSNSASGPSSSATATSSSPASTGTGTPSGTGAVI
ncbi:ATP-binding protein, partial [Streptomyces sp. NPDC001634]